MIENWYASYVFLGLSLGIGLLVYLVYRDLKRRQRKRQESSPLRELEKKYLKGPNSEADKEFEVDERQKR